MTGIDQAALAAATTWDSTPIRVLDAGPQTRSLIPQPWWPAAESADPEDRKRAALALWNAEFLDLIPHYAQALRTALVDVRVAQHSWLTAPSLDYVLRRFDGELVVWVGEDPRTFTIPASALFGSVPAPVRTFLRQVHAGFSTYDGTSCGVNAPSDMTTLAAYWGRPTDNDVIEWEEDHPFPGSQRLLLVTGNDTAHLFTSPDLPADTAVVYFEPDYEIHPFGPALDMFLNMPLGGVP